MQISLSQFYFYRPQAVLKVTGEDTFTFLQGQFTNELREPAGSVVYGLWLNQKGKVMADSYVFRLAESEFLLLSVTSGAIAIRQRLEQYVIADDVVVLDETEKISGVALWGNACGNLPKDLLGDVPARGHFLQKDGLLIFHGRRTNEENYEMIGPEEAVARWRERLLALGVAEVATDAAERVRISSGIPSVPQDIGPTDLPNEAGLETSAISYTKGCYLGQEIMARLKNLGQVRRHLRGVRGAGAPPKPGATLFQGSKKVGEVRSAVSTGDGFVALAMLTRIGLDENSGFTFGPADEAVQKATVWTS